MVLMVGSLDTIVMCAGGGWGPIEQHGVVLHGQDNSHPLVELPSDITLLLYLHCGNLVPTPKGLHGHGDELNPLPPTRLSYFGHLPGIGCGQGNTRCCGSLRNMTDLERIDDNGIEGCASSSGPVWVEDIPRSCFGSREQISFLPGAPKQAVWVAAWRASLRMLLCLAILSPWLLPQDTAWSPRRASLCLRQAGHWPAVW